MIVIVVLIHESFPIDSRSTQTLSQIQLVWVSGERRERRGVLREKLRVRVVRLRIIVLWMRGNSRRGVGSNHKYLLRLNLIRTRSIYALREQVSEGGVEREMGRVVVFTLL